MSVVFRVLCCFVRKYWFYSCMHTLTYSFVSSWLRVTCVLLLLFLKRVVCNPSRSSCLHVHIFALLLLLLLFKIHTILDFYVGKSPARTDRLLFLLSSSFSLCLYPNLMFVTRTKTSMPIIFSERRTGMSGVISFLRPQTFKLQICL